MKKHYLIQDLLSREYLTDSGTWTTNAMKAAAFSSIDSAEDWIKENRNSFIATVYTILTVY